MTYLDVLAFVGGNVDTLVAGHVLGDNLGHLSGHLGALLPHHVPAPLLLLLRVEGLQHPATLLGRSLGAHLLLHGLRDLGAPRLGHVGAHILHGDLLHLAGHRRALLLGHPLAGLAGHLAANLARHLAAHLGRLLVVGLAGGVRGRARDLDGRGHRSAVGVKSATLLSEHAVEVGGLTLGLLDDPALFLGGGCALVLIHVIALGVLNSWVGFEF